MTAHLPPFFTVPAPSYLFMIVHHSQMFQQIIFLQLSLSHGCSHLVSNDLNMQALTCKDHTPVHQSWTRQKSISQYAATMSGALIGWSMRVPGVSPLLNMVMQCG